MTKKTFVAIAAGFAAQLKMIKRCDPICPEVETMTPEAFEATHDTILRCAIMFCNVAEVDNPRFDRALFLTACGF